MTAVPPGRETREGWTEQNPTPARCGLSLRGQKCPCNVMKCNSSQTHHRVAGATKCCLNKYYAVMEIINRGAETAWRSERLVLKALLRCLRTKMRS